MARHLKRGRTQEQSSADARKVRDVVTGILEAIEARGDAALRDASTRFDKWDPPSFRLDERDIERCVSVLDKRSLDDIRFAQAQVRNFAQIQRDSMHDVEVETLPGVILGHRNLPVESVGCY